MIHPWVSNNCEGPNSSDDFPIKEGKCQNIQLHSFVLRTHGHSSRNKYLEKIMSGEKECAVGFFAAQDCLDSAGTAELSLLINGPSFFDGDCHQFDPLGGRTTGSVLFECDDADDTDGTDDDDLLAQNINSTRVLKKTHIDGKSHSKAVHSTFSA